MPYRVVWEETCSVGIEEALDAGESARHMRVYFYIDDPEQVVKITAVRRLAAR